MKALVTLGDTPRMSMHGRIIHTVYGDGGDSETPYMTRITLGRLRLHVFWRGDKDPDHHDHPWGFWTFPLHSYLEEVVETPEDGTAMAEFLGLDPGVFVYQSVVTAWRLHYRPATHTHRVLGRAQRALEGSPSRWANEVAPGPIVTIVWRERASRDWGFLKLRDGRWCWQDWKTYIWGGGREAPCQDEDVEDEERQRRIREAMQGE